MIESKGYIYIIKNDINNKVYIGKTIQSINQRFNQHKKDRHRKGFDHRPLYRAFNKYGIEHFGVEEIECCNINILSDREQYGINFYDTYKNGYNATLGGDGKILYNYQEIINGFLSGKLIKELAEEFECDKGTISKILKTANIDGNINEKQKKSRQVICLTKNDEYINTFNSLSDAARGIKQTTNSCAEVKHIVSNITKVLKQERKTAYGFHGKEVEHQNRGIPFRKSQQTSEWESGK